MKRHESFNQRVTKGNVDLIFIGDSITHAWESSGKAVWEKYYAKRNAVNLGISGDRTQHVLWRLDNGNIKNIHPKNQKNNSPKFCIKKTRRDAPGFFVFFFSLIFVKSTSNFLGAVV